MLLADGAFGRAAVPSGASTGEHEALELRDDDPKRYCGKGVLQAVANVTEVIAPSSSARTPWISGGSTGCCSTSMGPPTSRTSGERRPRRLARGRPRGGRLVGVSALSTLGGPNAPPAGPVLNVINGGAHADNELELQEFMLEPVGAASLSEATRWCSEIYQALKAVAEGQGPVDGRRRRGRVRARDLERRGGAAAARRRDRDRGARGRATRSRSRWTGLFRALPRRRVPPEGAERSSNDMVAYWRGLLDGFPVVSLEDGLAQDDWEGWAASRRARLGCQIVGDDLFVTDPDRLARGSARASRPRSSSR